MAVEALTVQAAGSAGATTTLHSGDFVIEDIDFGNPATRDEWVSSADSDGSLPMRTLKRENREVVIRVRVNPQTTMDLALTKIRNLEKVLESAERYASAGIWDPTTDPVRLNWTPASSSAAIVLPVYSAHIEDVPKKVQGDDAGYFINAPVFTIRCVCDPLGYSSTNTQLVQDAITTDPFAQIVDVPVSGGVVKPWITVRIEEQEAIARNSILLSGEIPKTTDSIIITPANLTVSGFSGTLSSGRIVTSAGTDWVAACSTGSQPHAQTYQVYALAAQGSGKIRFRYGVEGDPQSLNATQSVDANLYRDVPLGAINVDRAAGGTWLGLVEVTGSVSFEGLLLVPTAAWAVAETEPGASALGTKVVDGNLTGSGTLNGHSLTLPGAQTWTVVSGTWTKVTGAVQKTAVSEASNTIATAGSSNYAGVAVFCDLVPTANWSSDYLSEMGILLRYVDASNYAKAYLRRLGPTGEWYLQISIVIGGVVINPGTGSWNTLSNPGPIYFAAASPGLSFSRIGCAIDTQGRWQLYLTYPSSDQAGVDLGLADVLIASGSHPSLAAGGTLATGKVGLLDRWSQSAACTRQFRNFRAFGNPISTAAVLPASKTIELSPAGMVKVDGSNRTRVNYRGGFFAPEPDQQWRLIVATRRFAQVSDTVAAGKCDNQRVTVFARKRYVQIPE